MSLESLCITWFLIEGVLLIGYAILDGFDFGVGILHAVVPRTDAEKRISMNSIGPLWDGNEVWLVTFGGALFAAFPEAYATAFSGFYVALMLLLFALIFRAVSLEFRSKVDSPLWRAVWDRSFSIGSGLAALLFGVAVGNAMLGMAIDAGGNVTGNVFDQLGPYPILVGLLTVALFAMHGGIFLQMKTEGEFQTRLRGWVWRCWWTFLALFAITTAATMALIPRATANFAHYPWAFGIVALGALAMANIPRCLKTARPVQAFLSSGAVIASLLALFGLALFPNLVTAANDPAHSVTIFNAASSAKTLRIMLLIAGLGMPFVLTYSAIIYWTFRGKVRLSGNSY